MTVDELLDKYRIVRRDIPELDNLLEVDWSALKHAHGEASDFPILINAALSDNERDREFALRLLHETIWHQGTIYQATAYAVPHIAELIMSPDVNNNADFAGLLASIAQGHGAFEHGFRDEADKLLWEEIFAKNGRNLDEVVANDSKWAETTRDHVRKYIRLLYSYLSHPNANYVWIASALACYPEFSEETIPLIEKALERENDEYNKKYLTDSLIRLKHQPKV